MMVNFYYLINYKHILSMSISKLTDTLLVQLVNVMKEWKMQFNSANQSPDNEITQFWFRKFKSHQLVGCCCSTKQKGHVGAKVYGGRNIQVSMPKG